MKLDEIEATVDGWFKRLADGASPGGLATVNAARVAATLAFGLSKEAIRSAILAGRFAGIVNEIRDVCKAMVAKAVPGPLRWVPCVRPGRIVDRAADWLIENESAFADALGIPRK